MGTFFEKTVGVGSVPEKVCWGEVFLLAVGVYEAFALGQSAALGLVGLRLKCVEPLLVVLSVFAGFEAMWLHDAVFCWTGLRAFVVIDADAGFGWEEVLSAFFHLLFLDGAVDDVASVILFHQVFMFLPELPLLFDLFGLIVLIRVLEHTGLLPFHVITLLKTLGNSDWFELFPRELNHWCGRVVFSWRLVATLVDVVQLF